MRAAGRQDEGVLRQQEETSPAAATHLDETEPTCEPEGLTVARVDDGEHHPRSNRLEREPRDGRSRFRRVSLALKVRVEDPTHFDASNLRGHGSQMK